MDTPPHPLTPDQAVDILVRGDQDARYELMPILDSATRPLRMEMRDRFFREARGPFSVKADSRSSAAVIRGWFLSAATVASPDPDRELRALLVEHLDPVREPAEWVRYWALVNLDFKFPDSGPSLAEKIAEADPHVLTRAVAHAVLARTDGSHTKRLVRWLESEKQDEVWAALRALGSIPHIDTVSTIVDVLHRASLLAAESIRRPRIHDALLALSPPQIVDRAAAEIERGMGPAMFVQTVIAGGPTWRHAVRKTARIFLAFSHRAAVVDELQKALPHVTDDLRGSLMYFLQQLGHLPPQVEIPSGPARIDFVYQLVLAHPTQFELLDTFSAAKLKELVSTMTTPLPHSTSEPNALWRAWVETVHAGRLSE